jgi:hypothetical protein
MGWPYQAFAVLGWLHDWLVIFGGTTRCLLPLFFLGLPCEGHRLWRNGWVASYIFETVVPRLVQVPFVMCGMPPIGMPVWCLHVWVLAERATLVFAWLLTWGLALFVLNPQLATVLGFELPQSYE